MSAVGSSSRGLRVVLAGATGVLGKEVREVLDASGIPISALLAVASEASIGAEVDFRGDVVFVDSEMPSLRGVDLLILCTPGSVALEVIREALRAEVSCIDCSGALSGSGEIPLVMVGRSPSTEITAPLVETPSGVGLGWARVLRAISESAGLDRVVGTVMQPATSAGRRGIEVLSSETIALLSQGEMPESDAFSAPVAFDCLPWTGDPHVLEEGNTGFEARLRREVGRLLGSETELAVTSVQVPTFVGEGSALSIQTTRPMSVEDARGVLEKAPGVDLWDQDRAPSTRDAAGCDRVLVGRVRRDPSCDRGLLLWLATDGLRLVASEVVGIVETRLRLN
ncbi:MAG: Asd/ArgC dimerization domain-containing protein [Myxococcota bacterium]|nr:Asd/ArgC dimerization domain-containing protein [Myxococcota bacterium]